MNRIIAVLAALAVAPAAVAEEAKPAAEAASSAAVEALGGKLEATEAALAEVKREIDRSKKLKLSGYVQARYRFREDAHYGGAASTIAQNGFFVRRGRLKAVYDAGVSQFVLQVDALPAGVTVKEAYASVKLPMDLALEAGLQLFPFGYEVAGRSSADLDTLERAEISRRFLGGEYDLGVSLKGKYEMLSWKIGLFNGNGLDAATGGVDNDQLKDVIGRVTADFGTVTAGLSGWHGKIYDYTRFDASGSPLEFDRQRFGADVQVFLDLLPIGGTALKGEYIWGRSWISSSTRGAGDRLGKTSSGWYATLTQNLGAWNQLAVRYERFIPDHGLDRDLAANQSQIFENAELQAALHTFVGENLKVSLAWYRPMWADEGDAVTASGPERDSFFAQVQARF